MTNALLVALILSVVVLAIVLSRGFSRLEHRLDNAVQQSIVPELSRGFSALDCILKTAIQKSLTPVIGALPDIENTIALVNVGGSAAIDIEWSLSGTNQSGSIAYLNPKQSWHIQVTTTEAEKLTVSYKSFSGEDFARTFDISTVSASENRLSLA
jgi:hypothetical protein